MHQPPGVQGPKAQPSLHAQAKHLSGRRRGGCGQQRAGALAGHRLGGQRHELTALLPTEHSFQMRVDDRHEPRELGREGGRVGGRHRLHDDLGAVRGHGTLRARGVARGRVRDGPVRRVEPGHTCPPVVCWERWVDLD